MKTLDYYLSLSYKMEIEYDTAEGGYVASFPDLKGCITCADTAEGVIKAAEEAKKEWILTALEDGYPVPVPVSDETYSGQFKLRMPKSLHKQLAEHSKREGISMNQYCLYLLAKNDSSTTSPIYNRITNKKLR